VSVAPLLTVADPRIVFEGDRGRLTEAVAGVSFSLPASNPRSTLSTRGVAIARRGDDEQMSLYSPASR
jgi:hypothetical protein